MRAALLFSLLAVLGCSKDRSVESCLACGETVSPKATTCPHCGEPNPSQTLRDELAAELARQKAEDKKKAEALDVLYDAEFLGPSLLTEEGRDILLIDNEEAQVAMVREMLDSGRDPFTDIGRKALADYDAAIQAAGKGKDNFEEAYEIVEKARGARATIMATAATKEQLAQMPAAFERLRKEVDRLAKERGKLPDEDTMLTVAFSGEMRDPWSLALRYRIVDAKAGKYVLSSAGPDLTYDTADDPRLECELRK